MERKALAIWHGGLKHGTGELSTESGILSGTPYSFATRFEGEKGTNPEELIGAAHAGCFSMALSMILGQAGVRPIRIDTTATVSLQEVEGGFAIRKIHLKTRVEAPGMESAAFEEATTAAREGCPVSRLMTAEITLEATLVN